MLTFSKTREQRSFYVEDLTAPISQTVAETFNIPGFTRGISREAGKYFAGRFDNEKLTQSEIDFRTRGIPLKAEEGISSNVLDLMIEDKKKELRRNRILSRSKDGIISGGANLVAGFAASLVDPIEALVSIVPVVGKLRYAQMLEKAGSALGRAGVRARVGGAGGLAGSAAIEPFIYSFAQARQEQYEFSDSFLNVVFGTVMGGGLHAAGGAIKDRFTRAPSDSPTARAVDNARPETREHVLRTAVDQYRAGKNIDITAILDTDPYYSYIAGKNVADIPEGTGGAKRGTSLAVDQSVKKVLLEAKKTAERGYEILTKGELKDLKGELKRNQYRITKADKLIEKHSPEVALRRGATRLKRELVKRNKEIDSIISKDALVRANRAKELSQIDKSLTALEKGVTDLADTPAPLRKLLDSEIKTRMREKNKKKLDGIIKASRKQGQYESNGLLPSAVELDKVSKHVEEKGRVGIDDSLSESATEVRALLDEISDDVDITKQLKEIDDEINLLEKEASEIEEVSKRLMACRGVNG